MDSWEEARQYIAIETRDAEIKRLERENAELREREQLLRSYLLERLGTSEASRDRDDFKRGYAQALEYAISLIDVPPTPLVVKQEDQEAEEEHG